MPASSATKEAPPPAPLDRAHVPEEAEAKVKSCIGDEAVWQLDESMQLIERNMQGKQLRTVSETYAKILGGHNKIGVETVEADQIDLFMVWILMPVAALFNSVRLFALLTSVSWSHIADALLVPFILCFQNYLERSS